MNLLRGFDPIRPYRKLASIQEFTSVIERKQWIVGLVPNVDRNLVRGPRPAQAGSAEQGASIISR